MTSMFMSISGTGDGAPAGPSGEAHLHDEQAAVGRGGAVDVADDRLALLVGPVEQDALQQVQIAARGRLGQEIAADELDAVGEAARLDRALRALDDLGAVEEYAARAGHAG